MKSMFTRRMGRMKRSLIFIVFVLCITMMIPNTASAAYYNTYTTVAFLNNAHSCYSTQGFAVGSTYTYSIKINNDETKAVIYRTRMSDGTTTLMTNGDNGTTYATNLGHANDIALHSNDGNYYMFVVTMKAGSMSLVKLKYVGTTYYKVGNYTIKYNGADKAMSGVVITGKDANNIYFLFKSGTNFYRGSLPLTATSGTIDVTHAFKINIEDALVNGSPVPPEITDFATQGIGYYNNTLYFPLTGNTVEKYKNVSIVLVYRNISTASGTIYADDNLSFRITSNAYPDLFEIEGVGIANGDKLWFNANRRKDSSDTASDNVAYFNGYSASEIVVDNSTSGRFSASSNWDFSSWNNQKYEADYRFTNPQAISDPAWYKMNVPATGQYDVYAWWPANSDYNNSTPYIIKTTTGNQTVYVDQRYNGGKWNYLGTFYLAAGDDWIIGVSRWIGGSGYVIADAVKLIKR